MGESMVFIKQMVLEKLNSRCLEKEKKKKNPNPYFIPYIKLTQTRSQA